MENVCARVGGVWVLSNPRFARRNDKFSRALTSLGEIVAKAVDGWNSGADEMDDVFGEGLIGDGVIGEGGEGQLGDGQLGDGGDGQIVEGQINEGQIGEGQLGDGVIVEGQIGEGGDGQINEDVHPCLRENFPKSQANEFVEILKDSKHLKPLNEHDLYAVEYLYRFCRFWKHIIVRDQVMLDGLSGYLESQSWFNGKSIITQEQFDQNLKQEKRQQRLDKRESKVEEEKKVQMDYDILTEGFSRNKRKRSSTNKKSNNEDEDEDEDEDDDEYEYVYRSASSDE